MKADLHNVATLIIKDHKGEILDRVNIDTIELKNTKRNGKLLVITEK